MHKGLRIGIAQINPVVGDFPGNAKRILAAYRECLEAGADLVLTPELALAGYPPRDLLLRTDFIERNLRAVEEVAAKVGEIRLIDNLNVKAINA